MQINRDYRSPNYTAEIIPVEFLVLHYTAGDLRRTLELFSDPAREVSSHFVIDLDGAIYEPVACSDGTVYRAWHAGQSYWFDGEQTWEGFNGFSIGIELVNLNGNLLPYPQAQYEALFELVARLRSIYPGLNNPERVLGHEHIAGWRGKADPGGFFDWKLFFQRCYPDQPAPERETICPPQLQLSLTNFLEVVPEEEATATKFWRAVSHITETSVRLWQEASAETP